MFWDVTEDDLEVVSDHPFNCNPLRAQWTLELEVFNGKLVGICCSYEHIDDGSTGKECEVKKTC